MPGEGSIISRFVVIALIAAVAGCMRSDPAPNGFSADFHLMNGQLVRLDYLDADHFSLAPAAGIRTLVVDRKIYLVVPPQSGAAVGVRVLHVGELAPLPAVFANQAPRVQASRLPADAIASWGGVGIVNDIDLTHAGRLGIPMRTSVSAHRALARAQFAIHEGLRPAMDMRLCADSVDELTGWWSPEVTAAGYAILANAAGVRLQGPLRGLDTPPELPANGRIEESIASLTPR